MGSVSNSYDYVIVGGGVSGVVVASRLRASLPKAHILVLEAGKDESNFELARYVKHIASVRGSKIDYAFDTVPQRHLDGNPKKAWAGRALSGGGAINVGAWLRGPAVDFERWAEILQDDSWTFSSLLPYFRKSENFISKDVDPSLHGSDGPMEIKLNKDIRRGKSYPLCEQMKQAWQESDPSVKWNSDVNSGDPLGMGDWATTFTRGERQFPHKAYNLEGVEIQTNSVVKRVILERVESDSEPRATGVEMADGRIISSRKEVIVCGGTYNSPKILLLSGVGPASELRKHGIDVQVDLPAVGQGLCDDMTMRQVWRLRHPERGLSFDSPLLTDHDLVSNVPVDFMVWAQAPHDLIREALAKDGIKDHHVFNSRAVHQEMYTMWMAGRSAALLAQLGLSNDGSLICSSTYNVYPLSRGSVSLGSADPAAPPVIDPNYYAAETDRAIFRDALRKHMHVLLGTEIGKSFVAAEVPPPGFPLLSHESSDEEIDQRVRVFAETGSHPCGTCAMGRVVDARLRVKGVKGLRVVDASVFPSPIATHHQAAVYAVAEKGASMIAADWEEVN
ncbi:uncharacterized protein Z520_04336 [Fonsecaea multimorphosa CBS 102226]|uniref:Glucose-methanol-choline oxidoreductase N-terminal domain-containing protein n=1 Tax=Fonsecaea multimorphosa CBS 102226 TaxID=1442371 RepID=A0A0D2HCS2_9EURO|nr:uncharacterized protein Z520_04336 [Fonsecaea multimorphosa CBS 102226]KIX99700.1 hypothetical protein Z520_04336 [Fonsecaea multimorphosa CBS 102226]OAL26750.1 hypothetical protein AYO22_04103 [Fonsecaea multimorphosa]